MDGRIIIDGHEFDADNPPDFGSIVCVAAENTKWYNPATGRTETHTRRTYKGLAADVDKLPAYANLATGSAFYAVDDSDVYREYEHTSGRWYTGE